MAERLYAALSGTAGHFLADEEGSIVPIITIFLELAVLAILMLVMTEHT